MESKSRSRTLNSTVIRRDCLSRLISAGPVANASSATSPEGHDLASQRLQRKSAQRREVSVEVVFRFDHDPKAAITFEDIANGVTDRERLAELIHVVDGQAVARQAFAVGSDAQVTQTGDLLNADIAYPGNVSDQFAACPPSSAKRVRSGP